MATIQFIIETVIYLNPQKLMPAKMKLKCCNDNQSFTMNSTVTFCYYTCTCTSHHAFDVRWYRLRVSKRLLTEILLLQPILSKGYTRDQPVFILICIGKNDNIFKFLNNSSPDHFNRGHCLCESKMILPFFSR